MLDLASESVKRKATWRSSKESALIMFDCFLLSERKCLAECGVVKEKRASCEEDNFVEKASSTKMRKSFISIKTNKGKSVFKINFYVFFILFSNMDKFPTETCSSGISFLIVKIFILS